MILLSLMASPLSLLVKMVTHMFIHIYTQPNIPFHTQMNIFHFFCHIFPITMYSSSAFHFSPNKGNLSHSHDVAILSKKVFIRPTTSGFVPNHVGVVRAISRIMQGKFEGPYTSWKKVPQDVQDL